MTGESHRRLIEFLEKQAGNYLRGVAIYTADDYEVIVLRDDLRSDHVRSELDQMIAHLRQESRLREQRAFPFGELTGTIRTFEDAMVMHPPHPRARHRDHVRPRRRPRPHHVHARGRATHPI